jgi:hypothetical protein
MRLWQAQCYSITILQLRDDIEAFQNSSCMPVIGGLNLGVEAPFAGPAFIRTMHKLAFWRRDLR